MFKRLLTILQSGLLRNIILGIYFITLIGEDYFLYTRGYFTRVYTRPTLLPLLFAAYLMQFISRNHLLIIGAMIAATLGDYLTIDYDVMREWTGLGCYTLCYFLLGVQFFKLEWFTFKTGKMALLISTLGLAIYIGIMQFFSHRHNLVIHNLIFVYIYAASIAFLCTSILNIYLNNKSFNFLFAVIAIAILIIGNIFFESSIFYFHRYKTWVDVVSATCYGLFHFLIIRGLIRAKDKLMGTEYFQRI